MNETQESIVSWMHKTFPGADPKSPRKAIRALEEMVELCLASGAGFRQIQIAVAGVLEKEGAVMSLMGGLCNVASGNRDHEKIRDESADVAIVLFGVAGIGSFDLMAEVDRKMAINRARKWAPRGDGTGYHVK
jgi:hypothetical protein